MVAHLARERPSVVLTFEKRAVIVGHRYCETHFYRYFNASSSMMLIRRIISDLIVPLGSSGPKVYHFQRSLTGSQHESMFDVSGLAIWMSFENRILQAKRSTVDRSVVEPIKMQPCQPAWQGFMMRARYQTLGIALGV